MNENRPKQVSKSLVAGNNENDPQTTESRCNLNLSRNWLEAAAPVSQETSFPIVNKLWHRILVPAQWYLEEHLFSTLVLDHATVVHHTPSRCLTSTNSKNVLGNSNEYCPLMTVVVTKSDLAWWNLLNHLKSSYSLFYSKTSSSTLHRLRNRLTDHVTPLLRNYWKNSYLSLKMRSIQIKLFENMIRTWDLYLLSQLELKSEGIVFFSSRPGNRTLISLISIWNSHESKTYEIQIKTQCGGKKCNKQFICLFWSITEKYS